jgi:hypothetical protein
MKLKEFYQNPYTKGFFWYAACMIPGSFIGAIIIIYVIVLIFRIFAGYPLSEIFTTKMFIHYAPIVFVATIGSCVTSWIVHRKKIKMSNRS